MMKMIYEQQPFIEIPHEYRLAAYNALEFSRRDLGLQSETPIIFVRQVTESGGGSRGRRYVGPSYELDGDRWLALAHKKHGIIISVDRVRDASDVRAAVFHEARHFYQRQKNHISESSEQDARRYEQQAHRAALGLAKTDKEFYNHGEFIKRHIDGIRAGARAGKIETRQLPVNLTRSIESGTVGRVSGLFIPYGQESQDLGFREIIQPGAFTAENLKRPNVCAFWNHDSGQVLGRIGAGTLRLVGRESGVYGEIDLPDTGAGRDALTLVKRGDVGAASFGFKVTSDSWTTRGAESIRTIEAAELFEISLVSNPAYLQTTVKPA